MISSSFAVRTVLEYWYYRISADTEQKGYIDLELVYNLKICIKGLKMINEHTHVSELLADLAKELDKIPEDALELLEEHIRDLTL